MMMNNSKKYHKYNNYVISSYALYPTMVPLRFVIPHYFASSVDVETLL